MPIILMVLLLLAGAGWFNKSWLPERPPREAAARLDGRSFQEKCRERFDLARMHLVASEQARGAAPDHSVWRHSIIHTGENPGGAGVWLTVQGEGAVYGAGVALDQSRSTFPSWYDFSPGAPDRISLWRDLNGRASTVAGFDSDPTRRAEFTREMQAAVDECLALPLP